MTDEVLIERYIEPNPDKGGKAEYRLKKYDLSVWAVVGRYKYWHDTARAAKDCRIPEEAVLAALAFYRRHQSIVDDRLEANEWQSGSRG